MNTQNHLNHAQQTLVINHKDYAKKLARKFNECNMDQEELDQEAFYGLCEAASRFDPNRGVTFSTYAYHYVEKYVLLFIEQQLQHGRTFYSYDTYWDDEEKSNCYLNIVLQLHNPYDMDAHACARSNRKYLHLLLRSILTAREYEVICSYYGIDCIEENECDLAKRLGVSHQAIHLSKQSAFKKIAKCPCISQLLIV